MAELAMAIDGFILLQEADAVLSDENPAWVEAAFAAFIKGGSEQALAGTDRIGAVGDNDVKRLRRWLTKLTPSSMTSVKRGSSYAPAL
jgi:hypothetical protein